MKSVVTGSNQFCGPAVLSIVTGKSVDECASVIGSISGQYEVREVKMADLLAAAKKMRFNTELIRLTGYSVYGSLVSLVSKPGLYIVALKRHVVAVEVGEDKKIYFCDNHTKEPINAASAARLGQNVENIWKVTKRPDIKIIHQQVNIVKRDYSNSITITIKKDTVCEDPEDSSSRSLGSISLLNQEELKEVVTKLGELING